MKTYVVTWEIEVQADSPEDAAHEALAIQRDEDSTAVVFDVWTEDESTLCRIDFLDGSVDSRRIRGRKESTPCGTSLPR